MLQWLELSSDERAHLKTLYEEGVSVIDISEEAYEHLSRLRLVWREVVFTGIEPVWSYGLTTKAKVMVQQSIEAKWIDIEGGDS